MKNYKHGKKLIKNRRTSHSAHSKATSVQDLVKNFPLIYVYEDAMRDKDLVGHVFHNSVTSNPVQCHLWCIHDCRCLSFNHKEKN